MKKNSILCLMVGLSLTTLASCKDNKKNLPVEPKVVSNVEYKNIDIKVAPKQDVQIEEFPIIDLDEDHSIEKDPYIKPSDINYTNTTWQADADITYDNGIITSTGFAQSIFSSESSNELLNGTISCSIKGIRQVTQGEMCDCGIYFGVKMNENNIPFSDGFFGYFYFINQDGYVCLGKYEGTSYTTVYAEKKYSSVTKDEEHSLKVIIQGRKVVLYVDGHIFKALKFNNALDYGRFGFHLRNDQITINNIVIDSKFIYDEVNK